MDCCSSDCEKAGMQVEMIEDPRVMSAAENLAGLLVETAEYQAFARASRAVQYDAEVGNLVSRLNGYPSAGGDDPEGSEEALKNRLEALPVVQEYHRAEAAIRALFSAVDSAISAAAGIEFTANAAAAACG